MKKEGKVGKVMHEYKTGKLKSSSGKKVTNPKQAIAIALSEAGMSKQGKRGGGVIMKSKKSTMGVALKTGSGKKGVFKGKETYGEEKREAETLKSKKISQKEFIAGEKSEGHKGEESNLAGIASAIASGKKSPAQYASEEAKEPDMVRGGGAIMASKRSTMGVAKRGGGAIMKSKRSTMGVALKGGGCATKGMRPAKMY